MVGFIESEECFYKMPNIKSAIKRMRQNEIRRTRNRQHRSQMRRVIKQFRCLLDDQKLEDARTFLPQVYSVIDQKAQKGIIHANAAARYKARLTKRLKESEAASGS